MYKKLTECQQSVDVEQLNYLWQTARRSTERDFGGMHTFGNRWLFPIAQLLKERPELNGQCLFISDFSWFDELYSKTTSLDVMSFKTDNFYCPSWTKHITYFSPQNLKVMLSILSPTTKSHKQKLHQSLFHLFRTTSIIENLFGQFSQYSTIPFRDLDIFVKCTAIPKFPNLVKVSVGGLYRLTPRNLFLLICALKFKRQVEISASPEFVDFYRKLYRDKVRIVKPAELTPILSTDRPFEYKPVCILEAIVDLDREQYLQNTFWGKCIFWWHSRELSPETLPRLYPRCDLPKLERYCETKFTSFITAMESNHIDYNFVS